VNTASPAPTTWRVCDQRGIAELVLAQLHLRFRIAHAPLRDVHGAEAFVVDRLAERRALLDLLIALQVALRLNTIGLRRSKLRLRGTQAEVEVLPVQRRQHGSRGHARTDIHQPLRDATGNAEREGGLMARLHRARVTGPRGLIAELHRHRLHRARCHWRRCIVMPWGHSGGGNERRGNHGGGADLLAGEVKVHDWCPTGTLCNLNYAAM
jgi:hypothetical protein